MRLATPPHRSLVFLGLIGGLALLAAAHAKAADGRDLQGRPPMSCPVQGGLDASSALAEARTPRDAREATGGPPGRRIDWRALLPAVTLRGRA